MKLILKNMSVKEVKYRISVLAYDHFMGLPTEPMFDVKLYEQDFLYGFIPTGEERLLVRSEQRDFFDCVKDINDYIYENHLDLSKISYPEIYKHVKPRLYN